MNREDYKNLLNDVYKRYFCSSQCVYYSECKKEQLDDGLFFNRAKLGRKYGEIRRILVVGKEAVAESQEITQTASLDEANNDHYRRTLYTLATILESQPKSDALVDLKDYEKLLDYICLTNYFKCSFTETETEEDVKYAKKRSGVKASKKMKTNCWRILIDEINALKPEIIIIQGRSYSDAFWKEICKEKYFGENKFPENGFKCGYEQLTKHKYQNGDPMYIVWAYHPTARAEKAWGKRLENLRYILDKLKTALKET